MNRDLPNIVLLAAWKSYLIAPYALALEKRSLRPSAIIFGGTKSQKSLAIHKERTGGLCPEQTIFDLETLNIPTYFVNRINDPVCIDLISRMDVDLLVNAGVQSIMSRSLLGAARIGTLNSHPGIMPKYRGCTCVEWSIFNDESVGATCHFVDEKIDAGPIVLSRKLKLKSDYSYEQVRADMVFHMAEVLSEGVELVINRKLLPSEMNPTSTDSYFDVIPEDKLTAVKVKLAQGKFRPREPL